MTGRYSTPRLLDFITGVSGILGRPVKPGDDIWGIFAQRFLQIRLRVLAARCARGMPKNFRASKNEGAGNAGCALYPRSRAQNCAKNAHEHTGSAEALRHSLRNGLTAYTCSPENRALLSPSSREYGFVRPVGLAKPPRALTPTAEASGPHDFAVRSSTVRQRAV
jgi:hypothetical protein